MVLVSWFVKFEPACHATSCCESLSELECKMPGLQGVLTCGIDVRIAEVPRELVVGDLQAENIVLDDSNRCATRNV